MAIKTLSELKAYLNTGNLLTIKQMKDIIDSLSSSSTLGSLSYSGAYRPAVISNSGYTNNTGQTAGLLKAWKIMPGISFTVSALCGICTTVSAGGLFRLGLYSDLNGLPNNLITGSDTGSLSCSALGLKEGNITPFFLTATTTYWIVLQINDSTLGLSYTANKQNDIWGGIGNPYYYTIAVYTGSYGALPNTLTGAPTFYVSGFAGCPVTYLKVQ